MVALAPARDFALLSRRIEDRRVIYLDSAATSLKPRPVIDRIVRFYEESCANIHRGNHSLSQEASDAYERARTTVARFLGASIREIVFTGGTTDGLNILAEALALERGDNVIVSILEHHSNVLPWMKRCEVRFLPERAGTIDLDRLADLIDARTRLVALSHVSNVTGAVHRVEDVVSAAHSSGVPVVIDAAQSAPHIPIDVAALGCDFLVCSGHKMLGPSGIGVLYLAESMWSRLGPGKVGGGTVDHVRTDGFDLKRAPYRFEAGTPNIEGAIGLGAAVEYLERLNMEEVAAHDRRLSILLRDRFSQLPGVRLLGPPDARDSIALLSLAFEHPHLDVHALGMILSDSYKVMARAGTHCAHPYFAQLGLPGAVRFSAHVYTSDEDIEEAAHAVDQILRR